MYVVDREKCASNKVRLKSGNMVMASDELYTKSFLFSISIHTEKISFFLMDLLFFMKYIQNNDSYLKLMALG